MTCLRLVSSLRLSRLPGRIWVVGWALEVGLVLLLLNDIQRWERCVVKAVLLLALRQVSSLPWNVGNVKQ